MIVAGEVAFAALDGLPLILPAEPHVLRRRLEALAREHGISLNVVVDADTEVSPNLLHAFGLRLEAGVRTAVDRVRYRGATR